LFSRVHVTSTGISAELLSINAVGQKYMIPGFAWSGLRLRLVDLNGDLATIDMDIV